MNSSEMSQTTPKKSPGSHQKRRPGTKNEIQTPTLVRNSERSCKTRVIGNLKGQASRLKRLRMEPCEVLFIIREIKSDKYKYMGFGEITERFEEGKPISSSPNFKKYKYTIPRIKDIKSKIQTLTPEKYRFSFIPKSYSLQHRQKMTLRSPPLSTMENEACSFERVKRKTCSRGGSRARSRDTQRGCRRQTLEKVRRNQMKRDSVTSASTPTDPLLDEEDDDNQTMSLEELFYLQENLRSIEQGNDDTIITDSQDDQSGGQAHDENIIPDSGIYMGDEQNDDLDRQVDVTSRTDEQGDDENRRTDTKDNESDGQEQKGDDENITPNSQYDFDGAVNASTDMIVNNARCENARTKKLPSKQTVITDFYNNN